MEQGLLKIKGFTKAWLVNNVLEVKSVTGKSTCVKLKYQYIREQKKSFNNLEYLS